MEMVLVDTNRRHLHAADLHGHHPCAPVPRASDVLLKEEELDECSKTAV